MARLETTYLNIAIEFLDAVFGPEKKAQYDSLPRLYNPLLGPLTSVNVFRPEVHDLAMYGTSAKHTPVGLLMRDLMTKSSNVLDTLEIPVGGKGLTMQQAYLGTMGELAERLLAVLHWGAGLEQFGFASHEQLLKRGLRALGPEELPLFADEQYADPDFGYVPFRSDMKLTWVKGTDLVSGEPVLAPAQLAVFYWKRPRGEPRIGYATTGGLAFHPRRRRAILHGIYENIERDAVNLRWYCKIPPPRVDVDLVEFLSRYLKLARPRVLTPYIGPVQVFLNTVDVGIPVFTVIALDRSRGVHAFLAGGGAWATRDRALVQALGEIGQMRTGLRLAGDQWAHIRADSDVSELTDFFYAPVYYGYAENLWRLAWYTAGPSTLAWDVVPSLPDDNEDVEYDACLDLLNQAGIRPIIFEFSAACWPGVSVTKVFMPQLTQAHIPSHPCLGHPRYYHVPQRLGLSDHSLCVGELNPDPLPFP